MSANMSSSCWRKRFTGHMPGPCFRDSNPNLPKGEASWHMLRVICSVPSSDGIAVCLVILRLRYEVAESLENGQRPTGTSQYRVGRMQH